MSEIAVYYQKENTIKTGNGIEFIKQNATDSFLWIDLFDIDDEVEKELEDFLKIFIQEEEEMVEIEMSARYIETTDSLVLNSNFLLNDFQKEPVSFILKNNILITVRSEDLTTFRETLKRINANPVNHATGFHVFFAILETRVELDADLIETITQQITALSNSISIQEADEELLMEIKNLQEKTMILRENIIDKQRAVSSLLRSRFLPREFHDQVTILIKDINSLLEHVRFCFDRLDYLQDTFLGFVNIEQNKIIKMFTVISVIFMPPTLIASIYGMNFTKSMPELYWRYGYQFSLFIMIAAVGFILFYFRKKKWL